MARLVSVFHVESFSSKHILYIGGGCEVMRKRIFEIVEVSKENDTIGFVYDMTMIISIVVSILPLAFKQPNPLFHYTDIVTTILFIVDYILRWITADYKMNENSKAVFIKYPFTPWAIIDLVSILPTLTILNNSFKLFRIFRTFRIIRIFKVFRYSNTINVLVKVVHNSKKPLLAVCTLAAGYILLSALFIFNVEPDSFDTFFDAVYWATVSLTTVGYGDIYPTTTAGRMITMVSSLFGIAIVALPSGIITAGYMNALDKAKKDKDNQEGGR